METLVGRKLEEMEDRVLAWNADSGGKVNGEAEG